MHKFAVDNKKSMTAIQKTYKYFLTPDKLKMK